MPQDSSNSAKHSKNVLIIGGGGFVAGHLISRFKSEAVKIKVLSRHRPPALPEDSEYIEGDFLDAPTVERCMENVDFVYHLANPLGRSWHDYDQNVVAPTTQAAKIASAAGVKQFFYTSSIDLYNSSQAHARITGETPADPDILHRNHYARAKAACECNLRKLDDPSRMRVTIFRLGLTIGKGGSHAHRGVGHFSSPTHVYLWGTGTNKLPFVLVDDVAEAFVLAMGNPVAAGQTLLICASPALTAREYMHAVAARAHVRISARPFPVWLFWAGEAAKESIKYLMRHPNRRGASLHDWQCRAHLADYDPTTTMQLLGWQPSSDKDSLVLRGINPAVDEFINHVPSQPDASLCM